MRVSFHDELMAIAPLVVLVAVSCIAICVREDLLGAVRVRTRATSSKVHGAALGVAAAITFALLQAAFPRLGSSILDQPWFAATPDFGARFLSAYMHAMPFAIIVGVALGALAHDLRELGFFGSCPLLVLVACACAYVLSLLGTGTTTHATIIAASYAGALAWITGRSEPVPTTDRDADPSSSPPA